MYGGKESEKKVKKKAKRTKERDEGQPQVVHKMPPQFPVTDVSRWPFMFLGARCSSVVRAFAHGAIGRLIDPSLSGPH